MPRFVILEHDWPHRHWDLMLEAAGVLQTWRLAEPPTSDHPVAAERIGDHRLAYLDYEGEISGGRGRVTRWEGGDYEITNMTNDELNINILGQRLRGELKIVAGKNAGLVVMFRGA